MPSEAGFLQEILAKFVKP